MGKASEWKRAAAQTAEIVDLTLPSGMVIEARRPDGAQLAQWGLVPSSLAGAVSGDAGAAAPNAQSKFAQIRDLFTFCCVSPRISLAPQGDDEIHPRDIPEKDWTFVVRWALRAEEAAALTSFRAEFRDVGDRGDGEAVELPAERPVGAVGPGYGSEL